MGKNGHEKIKNHTSYIWTSPKDRPLSLWTNLDTDILEYPCRISSPDTLERVF